jgi:hypothetical protein
MKMPPKQKVYEAFSAIADGRVHLQEKQAEVQSSDRAKTYTVEWDDTVYRSNDNATYWAGYPGYPVLAVWMLQGKLPYDPEVIPVMAGIPWKQLNEEYRRDYDAAAAEAMRRKQEQGADTAAAEKLAEQVYEALNGLNLSVKRGSRRPPK